ncbi:MAG: riboflavin synthase [Deltaproteobacteria bacterium]|nr:riboflavin synthase [Deltaproteobacteria bacterium]MBW2071826.1 riboflavin synthase [Deltaproteobacteria bacterium]
MFTGLVEGVGTIVRLQPRAAGMRLSIQAPFDLTDVHIGESIAVEGACLTVISIEGNVFTVDVSQETLQRTTLAHQRHGDKVNLERALKLGDRLGGHLVNGHVDGRGRLLESRRAGESQMLRFAAPPEVCRYLVEKGSVAVNGVSLTINRCSDEDFEVNIVPHTARSTTLGSLQVGTEVNIEVDPIGKYVEKFMRQMRHQDEKSQVGVDRNFLGKHGFL